MGPPVWAPFAAREDLFLTCSVTAGPTFSEMADCKWPQLLQEKIQLHPLCFPPSQPILGSYSQGPDVNQKFPTQVSPFQGRLHTKFNTSSKHLSTQCSLSVGPCSRDTNTCSRPVPSVTPHGDPHPLGKLLKSPALTGGGYEKGKMYSKKHFS